MQRHLLIFLAVVLVCSCKSVKRNQIATSVELYRCIKSFDVSNGEPVLIKDSVFIYKFDKYVVYKIPTLKLIFKSEKDKTSNTIIQKLTDQKVSYQYFVHEEKQLYGYYYDSLASTPKKILVDSIERGKALKGVIFYRPEDILVSSKTNNTSQLLEEVWIPSKKTNYSIPDSTHYYYDVEFKEAPYSFSRYLDSSRNSKLVKIRALFYRNQSPESSNVITEREFLFQLKRVANAPEIPELLNKFKSLKIF